MPRHSEQREERAFRRLLRSVGPDTTPTPGFEERLLDRMLAKAKAGRTSIVATAGRRTKRTLARLGPAVAAAILLAFGLWWLLAGNVRVASADFSEMLRRVREARSVTFDVVIQPVDQPEDRIQVSMARPGLHRSVWAASGRVHISDASKDKALDLWPQKKQATLHRYQANASRHDPMAFLEAVGESSGQLIGRKMLNNKEAFVYQLTNQGYDTYVWVDPQQELPVRIETRSTRADGQEFVWFMENFRWNAPIPDSQFSMKVPPGYTLEDRYKDATEKSLLDLLRVSAEMGGGSFPANLDLKTICNLVFTSSNGKAYRQTMQDDKAADGTALATGAVTVTVMDDKSKEKFRTCRRGIAFIKQIKDNGGWQYAGGGKKLGDETATICWWKPQGSANYRVVYGDLSIENTAESELPLVKNRPVPETLPAR